MYWFYQHIGKRLWQIYQFFKKSDDNFENIKNIKNKSSTKLVLYKPENISIRSPITIINAPWGTGKTFFIENICNLFQKGEMESSKIKNVLIIDAWKFSCSKEMPEELISELFYMLCSDKKDEMKNLILECMMGLFNVCAIPWINRFTGFDIQKIKNKMSMEKKLNELNKQFKELTLIFLDNIERVGKNSWDIIKSIHKLTILNNFIFVMPMNMDRLNNSQTDSGEWSIEKYINIPLYNFKQNYLPVLAKYQLDQDNAKILNKLLNITINGQILSIRELENILKKSDLILTFNQDKYMGLKKFGEIWNVNNEIEKIISDDIILMWNKLLEIDNLFKKYFWNEVDKSFLEGIINFTSDIEDEGIIILNKKFVDAYNFLQKYKFIENFNKNLFHEIETFLEMLNNIKDALEKKYIELKKSIKEYKQKIEKQNNVTKDIENEINEIQNFMNDYNTNKIEHNANNNKIFSHKNAELSTQKNGLLENQNKYKELENKLEFYEKNYNGCEELLNSKNNLKLLIKEMEENKNSIKNWWKILMSTKNEKSILEQLIVDKNDFDKETMDNRTNEMSNSINNHYSYMPSIIANIPIKNTYEINDRIPLIINKLYKL